MEAKVAAIAAGGERYSVPHGACAGMGSEGRGAVRLRPVPRGGSEYRKKRGGLSAKNAA